MNAPRTPHPRTTALALAAATALTLTACTPDEGPRTGVVVTTNILGDLTRAVVGEETGVTVLMKPDADPHSFEISARQAATVERASLIVSNGLGLEEGVQAVVDAAQDSGVAVLPVAEGARHEG